jgi:two-component system sensor histidine kinase UhpB
MSAVQGVVPNHSLHILLISDHPDDRFQIMRALRREFPGLEVEQVRSEKQLTLALASGGFSLAFIESRLPWTDSLSVVRALQAGFPGCPVIMIADAEREEIILRAIQAGLDSYVLRSSQQMMCLPAAVRLALERTRERQAMKEAEDRELERAEMALRESEERFRTIVEQSPISIQVMTPDGWTVQVNRAWEELWGVTAADVRNYNMLHDEQANSLGMMPHVERGFAGEMVTMPPVAYHTPETLKTGRKRWFQARIYPVKGDRDEIRNVIMMYEDITERQWATEDLQKLSAELMNAQEAERKRISQELHDELGQALTAMRINLAALEKDLSLGLPTSRNKLSETGVLVDETLEHVRELSHALRPTMLDELGLVPTLRWYVNRYAERLGIEVEFEAMDLGDRPAAEIETALYRIVQEALTNIAKHAQARRVHLRLSRQESKVTALIEDDGIGFDVQKRMAADAPGSGAGLFGMRERVALWGGTFTIQSRPDQGTRLFVELPLSPHSPRGKS